jgi:hypothetical protein
VFKLVVEITVEILFPHIPCFISFISSGNEADQAGTTQEGFPYYIALEVHRRDGTAGTAARSITGDSQGKDSYRRESKSKSRRSAMRG